jgi:hypothetical protein
MGLRFYDSDQNLYSSTDFFRSVVDGHVGGIYEEVFYLRNDDATRYFTNIIVSYLSDVYSMNGPDGDSGWGIKFMYGERRPTEAEWDLVRAGDPIQIPNIGSTEAEDTSTYHPIWVRIYCPGNQTAQNRGSQTIRVSYLERVVGG